MVATPDSRIVKRAVTVNRRANKQARKMYATKEEMEVIIPEAGDSALLLYEYYLSRSNSKNTDFSDIAVHRARPFWSVAKIKRNRLRLTKLGFFRQVLWKNNKKRKLETFLGREAA